MNENLNELCDIFETLIKCFFVLCCRCRAYGCEFFSISTAALPSSTCCWYLSSPKWHCTRTCWLCWAVKLQPSNHSIVLCVKRSWHFSHKRGTRSNWTWNNTSHLHTLTNDGTHRSNRTTSTSKRAFRPWSRYNFASTLSPKARSYSKHLLSFTSYRLGSLIRSTWKGTSFFFF